MPDPVIDSFLASLKRRGKAKTIREVSDMIRERHPNTAFSTVGQGNYHAKKGLDHTNASDIAVNPNSPEGQAIIADLDKMGVPYVAATGKESWATGPHVHVGNISERGNAAPGTTGDALYQIAEQLTPTTGDDTIDALQQSRARRATAQQPTPTPSASPTQPSSDVTIKNPDGSVKTDSDPLPTQTYQPADWQEAAVMARAKAEGILNELEQQGIAENKPEIDRLRKLTSQTFDDIYANPGIESLQQRTQALFGEFQNFLSPVVKSETQAAPLPKTTPSSPTPSGNYFQGEEMRQIDRTAGAPAPDPRAAQTSAALRLNAQEASRFERATPEMKRRMLVGAYVNNLPAGDRDAATKALERIRAYNPEYFDEALSQGMQLRDVDTRVATWAQPGDKEITLSVDTLIPELTQAYKEGGPQAFDTLFRMRTEERGQFQREQSEKEAARQTELAQIKNDFGTVDNSALGKTEALAKIAGSSFADMITGIKGGAADIAGALAGKVGLDALDRELSNYGDQQQAKREALSQGQEQMQQQANLSDVSTSIARLGGQLPVIVGGAMVGGAAGTALGAGSGAGAAGATFASGMLGSTREEPLKALANSYVDALSMGLVGGGKGIKEIAKGVTMDAASDVLVLVPDFVQVAAMRYDASQHPKKYTPQQIAAMDKKLSQVTADAIAATLFAAGGEAVGRSYDKLHERLTEQSPLYNRILRDPEVIAASDAIDQTRATVLDLQTKARANQEQLRKGFMPAYTGIEQQLQAAQVAEQTAVANYDAAIKRRLPMTPEQWASDNRSVLQGLFAQAPATPPAEITSNVQPATDQTATAEDDFVARLQSIAQTGQVPTPAPAETRDQQIDRFFAHPETDALLNQLGENVNTPKGAKEVDRLIQRLKKAEGFNDIVAEDVTSQFLSPDQQQQERADLKAQRQAEKDAKVKAQADALAAAKAANQTADADATAPTRESYEEQGARLSAWLEEQNSKTGKPLLDEAAPQAETPSTPASKPATPAMKLDTDLRAKLKNPRWKPLNLPSGGRDSNYIAAKEINLPSKPKPQFTTESTAERANVPLSKIWLGEKALNREQLLTATENLKDGFKESRAEDAIVIAPDPKNPDSFVVVAGQHRIAAAKLMDYNGSVPVIIRTPKAEAPAPAAPVPEKPLFGSIARDPEYIAQQQRANERDKDARWTARAEAASNRKPSEQEQRENVSPIAALKRQFGTINPGMLKGEAKHLREGGVHGLLSSKSSYTVNDAREYLRDSGYEPGDGRTFDDLFDDEVFTFLEEQGTTARPTQYAERNQEQQLAEEEEAFYRNKEAQNDRAADTDGSEERTRTDNNPVMAMDDAASGSRTITENGNVPQEQLPATIANTELGRAPEDDGVNSPELTDTDLIEMAAAWDNAQTDAIEILGQEDADRAISTVEQFHNNPKFVRTFRRIRQGDFTPDAITKFNRAAVEAGFEQTDIADIIKYARQNHQRVRRERNQRQQSLYAGSNRRRTQNRQTLTRQLTEEFGGQFVYSQGESQTIFTATIEPGNGSGKLLVKLSDQDGVFSRFDSHEATIGEDWAALGLEGVRRLPAIQPRIPVAELSNNELRNENNRLIQSTAETYDKLQTQTFDPDERAAVERDANEDYARMKEAQAEMLRRGLLTEPPSREKEHFSKQALRDDFYAKLAEKQKAEAEGKAAESQQTSLLNQIDEKAHEAATSPKNDLPEPTQAQKEAGNYQKGHIQWNGLDISIENPIGSTRSGKDQDGETWNVRMSAHYGYIKRTEGADGEHVDVYIGPTPESDKVFIIDQIDADTGKFDEHKVVLGVNDFRAAEKLYDAHFDDKKGSQRRGAITTATIAEFKDWLKDGDTTKPIKYKENADRPTGNTDERFPDWNFKFERNANDILGTKEGYRYAVSSIPTKNGITYELLTRSKGSWEVPRFDKSQFEGTLSEVIQEIERRHAYWQNKEGASNERTGNQDSKTETNSRTDETGLQPMERSESASERLDSGTTPSNQSSPASQSVGVIVRRNEAQNGIEIKFPSKPDEATIKRLKNMGFRWSTRGHWYAKQTPKRNAFADKFAAENASLGAKEQTEENKAVTATSKLHYSNGYTITSSRLADGTQTVTIERNGKAKSAEIDFPFAATVLYGKAMLAKANASGLFRGDDNIRHAASTIVDAIREVLPTEAQREKATPEPKPILTATQQFDAEKGNTRDQFGPFERQMLENAEYEEQALREILNKAKDRTNINAAFLNKSIQTMLDAIAKLRNKARALNPKAGDQVNALTPSFEEAIDFLQAKQNANNPFETGQRVKTKTPFGEGIVASTHEPSRTLIRFDNDWIGFVANEEIKPLDATPQESTITPDARPTITNPQVSDVNRTEADSDRSGSDARPSFLDENQPATTGIRTGRSDNDRDGVVATERPGRTEPATTATNPRTPETDTTSVRDVAAVERQGEVIAETATQSSASADNVVSTILDKDPKARKERKPKAETAATPETRPEAVNPPKEPKPRKETPLYNLTSRSFAITPEVIDRINSGGQMTKFRQNMEAVKLLRELQIEGRQPTLEEKNTLALYAGWGGIKTLFEPHRLGYYEREEQSKWYAAQDELKKLIGEEAFKEARTSILNAHYTDPTLVRTMWTIAERLGFTKGRVLEPAMGTGNFFGMAPAHIRENSSFTGIEKDSTTGQIARILYPDANIHIKGYEEHQVPDDFYDLAISNVPFGDYRVSDARYDKFAASIHNYFFLKTMDKVKPGGLVMFITSTGTMDAKRAENVRKALYEQADLVSVIRFPAETFQKNALTSVVTDLVILRKRGYGEEPGDGSWVQSKKVTAPDNYEVSLNSWLADHQENMLGEFIGRNPQYNNPRAGLNRLPDFKERFADLIWKLPTNVFDPDIKWRAANNTTAASRRTKQAGYEVKDGKLHRSDATGLLTEVEADPITIKKAEGLLGIRDALNQLTDATMGRIDESPMAMRAALNKAYDSFVAKYGPITKNEKVLAGDPDLPRLLSLEDYNPKTKTATKRPIFNQDSITGARRDAKPQNATEAMVQSLHKTGTVDIQQMAEALGQDIETIRHELANKGLAFETPSGTYEIGAKYLSGNVRLKLAEAREAAKLDDRFETNVKALEAVQNADVDHTAISVRMGASWMQPDIVRQFMADLLKTSIDNFQVHYDAVSGKWFSAVDEHARYDAGAMATWSVTRENGEFVHPIDLIQHLLDGTTPKIYDVDRATKTRTFNAKDTEAAASKMQSIRDRFNEWIWEDDGRQAMLLRQYNDQLNSLRPAEYDPTPFLDETGGATVPGLNSKWSLRPHQYSAVMRSVIEKRAIMAHEVGLGKTLAMIASASELKRLGIARKPAIAVPKKVLPGFLETVRDAFPLLKVHVVDSSDADSRQLSVAQIATTEHDLVLMTHNNLDMMKMQPEFEKSILQKELDEVDAVYQAVLESIPPEKRGKGGKRSPENKILEKIIKRRMTLKAKIDEATTAKSKDDAITFEDTGIDFLFVDEFHKYKSLPITTSLGSVKGIPTGDSQRAINMLMRIRYLQQLHNGGGIVAATGTPVSNSLAEAYVMSKFLQPDIMEQSGVQSFDAWARNFAEPVTALELSATGEWKPQTRLAKFTNLPELQLISRATLDVKTAKATGILEKRPQRIDKTITVPMVEGQQMYLKHLQERAEDIKKKRVEPWEDNFLVVSGDGRAMASDMRMVVPNFKGETGHKVKALVKEVMRIYREKPGTTQMIFSDTGVSANAWGYRLYDDIMNQLADAGIPRNKIIDFSKLDSDTKVEKAVSRLNSGDAVIAIGHRENMGTGVNAQQRMAAVHQFDVPWKPALIEQSEARGWRQGNQNKEVEILSYVTEGSFDAVMWSAVARKQKAIQQFMAGESTSRTIEEDDDGALSYDQIAAIASGDMDYLLRAELQAKAFKLTLAARNHESEQRRNERILQRHKDNQVYWQNRITIEKQLQTLAQTARERDLVITSRDGRTFTKKDDAAPALLADFLFLSRSGYEQELGTYKGMKIISDGRGYLEIQLGDSKATRVDINVNLEKFTGTFQSIDQVLAQKAKGESIQYAEKQLNDAIAFANEMGQMQALGEFPKRQELEDALRQLDEVEKRLEAKQADQGETQLYTAEGQDIREMSAEAKALRQASKVAKEASTAKSRLRKREAGYVNVDLLIPDFIAIAVEKLAQGIKTFKPFADEMIQMFGEKFKNIRKALRPAWEQAVKFWNDERGAMTADLSPLPDDVTPKRTPKEQSGIPANFDLADYTKRALKAIKKRELDPTQEQAAHAKLEDIARAIFANDGRAMIQHRRQLAEMLATDAPSLKSVKGVKKGLIEAANLPRAIKASMDFSAPLRQGAIESLNIFNLKPSRFREQLTNWRKMFTSMGADAYLNFEAELAQHPRAALADKVRLYRASSAELDFETALTEREEQYLTNLAGKIPIVSHSERAYKAFLDMQRIQAFDRLATELERAGLTFENNPREFIEIADFINKATGRGTIPEMMKSMAPLLNSVLFSPRYLASRFQLLDPRNYINAIPGVNISSTGFYSKPVARKAAKEMIGFVAAVGIVTSLGLAAGAAVSTDPDDPDFLKMRWGNYRYDLLAGLQQEGRFLWRLMQSFHDRRNDAVSVTARFLRGKLSPIPGVAVNIWTGKTFTGEDVTVKGELINAIAPLLAKDLYEGYAANGLAGAAKMTPGIFGVGVQHYEKKGTDTGFKLPERSERNGVKEPEAIYQKRIERAKQWHAKYGQALLDNPKFKAASPDEQKKIREIYQRRVTEESAKNAPDTGRLAISVILESLRQSKQRPTDPNKLWR